MTIVRDPYGVAHVTGKTEADVAFGAGWVTAADRGLLLQLIPRPSADRSPRRPVHPLAPPSPEELRAERRGRGFLANQLDAVRSQRGVGPKIRTRQRVRGRDQRLLPGEVGSRRALHGERRRRVGCAIAARFGTNGGQEVGNAMFSTRSRSASRRRRAARVRGSPGGERPESPVSASWNFAQELPAATSPGSVLLDDGSFTGTPLSAPAASPPMPPCQREAIRNRTCSSSQARRSVLLPSSSEVELRVPASRFEAPSSRAFRSFSSDAGPTSRGARRHHRPTISTSFVETLCDDDTHYSTAASASRCAASSAGNAQGAGSARPGVSIRTSHDRWWAMRRSGEARRDFAPALGHAVVSFLSTRARSTRAEHRRVTSAKSFPRR